MSLYKEIRELVESTPFIDTHEHLIEESARLRGYADNAWLFPCDDWSYLLMHYLGDDLASAGMTDADLKRFLSPELGTEEKYRLVAPYWERTKHTGYAQAVRYTLDGLYGVKELNEKTAPRLAEMYKATVKPGFYKTILRDRCNIENCQVNSLESLFMETENPDLLKQDIGFPPLSSDLDLSLSEKYLNRAAKTLDDWLELIDYVFATFGSRAVAAKNQSAYSRRLNYEAVPQEVAEPLFARLASGESLSLEEKKSVQDFLFRYCVQRATEAGLPVKLHTGYYAGHNNMPLSRLRENAGDLCPLLKDFPDTKFVLMHIGYPYQDEFISLAKHYRNVYIDMCWAWIINPMASIRFVKEYLLAAPANKLFTFGGDYITVENIYGHSRIARLGLTQAVTELVESGWVPREEARLLIERIMRQNALETFPKT